MTDRTPRSSPTLPAELATALAISWTFACAGPEPRPAAPSGAAAPQDPSPPPPEPGSDDADWVHLRSGEWLTGEIIALDDDDMEFESEELDTLELDWADIVEVRTKRSFTVLLADRSSHTGVLTMDGARVSIRGESGEAEFARGDVYRIVPGTPRERNYWSGEVALHLSARSGNTDQSDTNASLSVTRETATSRLPMSFATTYTEVDSKETANNKRLSAQYDRFLGPRLFVTPLGVDAVEDRFQNIEVRVTPFTAVGYTVVDRRRWTLDVTGGVGYRWTRFDSVPAGEDDEDSNATIVLGTTFSSDLTKQVELDATYVAYVSVEDASDTVHQLTIDLSVDIWRALELDIAFVWDRVGEPEENADGDFPEQDDFRLMVGLIWTF